MRILLTRGRKASLFLLVSLASAAADAEPVGEVVTVRGDEQIRPAGGRWQPLDLGRKLDAGDTVQTGAYGGAAVLLNDQTQMRIHRNSELSIRAVRESEQDTSVLELASGALWARARSLLRSVTGQLGRVAGRANAVRIETVTATIGIRGTDWYAAVDDQGVNTLIVLAGAGQIRNDAGSLEVLAGEVATARPGQPPTKLVRVDLRDRPLFALDMELAWLPFISLDGRPPTAGRGRAGDALAAAEQAFAQGQYTRLESLLADPALASRTGEAAGRVALLRALLAVAGHDAAAARRALDEAQASLSGRRKGVAETVAAALLMEENAFAKADARLSASSARSPDLLEPHLLLAWLSSAAGDHRSAAAQAEALENRFADDPRPPTLLAYLNLLLDRRTAMLAAIERAQAIDPGYGPAWYMEGLYALAVEPDGQRALRAYRRAVDAAPGDARARNDLGIVHFNLGDFDASEQAFQAGIAAQPNFSTIHANYGYMLAFMDRLDEAERELQHALALRPDDPYGLIGVGFVEIFRGEHDAAVDKMLKATTANPDLPGGSGSLASAYYQAGNFVAADKELENARRLDPNDPIPDVIGAIMAADQFRAGEAVRLARSGFRKSIEAESFAVENLANAKGGGATLGAAYTNLGLNEWGGYYTLLAFDPYLANGYFYLSQANQFGSERARLGAGRQGLMLDPLAVSFPNRYYEPYRRPGDYFNLSASGGSNGGATYGASANVQGFKRLPAPVAYTVSAFHSKDEGFRSNTRQQNSGIFAQFGASHDNRKHNVLFDFDAQRFESGLAGPTGMTDPDDEVVNEFVRMALGYQYRLAFDNRVMARVLGGVESNEFRNGRPLGGNVGNRDLSLLLQLGLDETRDLYRRGLFDATACFGFTPADPIEVLVVEAITTVCPFPGFPPLVQLDDTLPGNIDPSIEISDETETRTFGVQLRHLLDIGAVSLTYGAEHYDFSSEIVQQQTRLDFFGVLAIQDATLEFLDLIRPGGGVFRVEDNADSRVDILYTQARWKPAPELWFDAGVFHRAIETELDEIEQFDPRLGAGWRIAPNHWLRFAAQRELTLPQRTADSLAPVDTMGLVVSDAFASPGSGGVSIFDLRARWDAEWSPHVFTFVELGRQRLEDFSLGFISESRFTLFDLDRGSLETARLGMNVWFLERFGFSAESQWTWTENESRGPADGMDLPLIPDVNATLALTWIHEKQISASIALNYLGEREADPLNTATLDDAWLLGASVSWLSPKRHWSWSASAGNLLDEDFELARGFPAAGASILITGELRF